MANKNHLEVRNGLLGYTSTPPTKGPTHKHLTRRYKAAKSGRLVNGFGSGLLGASSRQETRQDLRGLINHSRFAAQNVDHLKSYEMMVRRHVVGWNGISLQMAAKDHSGKLDKPLNKALEGGWKRWGQRGNCTPCGRLSWWQIEKVSATMLAREGNFLLREFIGPQFGPFGYQVQPISVDLLDLDLVQTLKNGDYIDGGIEFSELGRPLAFYFFDGHPQEAHTGRGRNRIRVPADQVIHVLRHTETGQALGVPESHTALRRFNMLHKYEESALTAAHYGAAAMVFLEQQDAGMAPNPAPTDEDEAELPDEMEAGSIVDLPPGIKATSNPSNYPDANMPGFMKSMLRGGSAGLGVSYAGLTSDMEGANFSSLKDGRGEERDEWRVFQRDLSEGLHNEVFKGWVNPALLSGKILPDRKAASALLLDDLQFSATWRGRGWASVNPKDDAIANDKNLTNRLTTPSDIVAERGEDFEGLVDRFARDMEVLNAANVPLSTALSGTPSPSTPDSLADQSEPDPEKG